MFRKKKKAETRAGPVKFGRDLYLAVGKEWEKIPPIGDHWVKYMPILRAR